MVISHREEERDQEARRKGRETETPSQTDIFERNHLLTEALRGMHDKPSN